MKRKLHLFLGICLCVILTACHKDNESPLRPDVLKGSRTVLVYIVADKNGLEENYNNKDFATQDIKEMMEGIKMVDTSLHNLLVYLDDGNTPMLFRITKDKKGNPVKQVIKEYLEQVSTDMLVMKDVFDHAFYEYPSESYGLIYWSHGDGWVPYPLQSAANTRWVGQDKGEGDKRMNISELAQVLSSAPHFDFILFDACFMQSIEVAYELRTYTDYYIGSPAENPGPGAPYHKIVPLMYMKNAAIELATEYFNVYNATYDEGRGISNSNWTGGTALSVLKTSQLEDLALLTNQLLPEKEIQGRTLRDDVFDYDHEHLRRDYVGYFDMVDMMSYILDEQSFKTWKEAFDRAVAYWDTTDMIYSAFADMFSMKGTNGVSHYIPFSTSSAVSAAYRSTEWYKDAGLSKLGW